MHMVILFLHIVIASIMVISSLGVLVAASKQVESKLYSTMMGSFALTLLSGTSLLFVTAGQLGRICATMTVITIAIVGVRMFYLKRVTFAPQTDI